jgi:hypothetical protein
MRLVEGAISLRLVRVTCFDKYGLGQTSTLR